MADITTSDNATTLVGKVNEHESSISTLTSAVNQLGGTAADTHLLRVCSWNIGHFAMGHNHTSWVTDQVSDYTNKQWNEDSSLHPNCNYAIQVKRWKHRIQGIGADILCLCEYSGTFGTSNSTSMATKDVVFDDYPYTYERTVANYYHQEAIYCTQKITGTGSLTLDGDHTQSGEYAKVTWATINIEGTDILVASTHFFWGADMLASRTTCFTALMTLIGQYDHAIIGGDFNVDSEDEFQDLVDAGLTLVSTPTSPVLTYPATGVYSDNLRPASPLDNIILKGFDIVGTRIVNDGLLSDHCGVVADIKLQ